MTLTPERARELGKLSAQKRRERPAFPPLDSPANAKLRLAAISNALMVERITPAMAHAQERLHREWRETYFAELDLRRLKVLEQRCGNWRTSWSGRIEASGGRRRERAGSVARCAGTQARTAPACPAPRGPAPGPTSLDPPAAGGNAGTGARL
jgi:hypothetical protein